VAKDGNEIPNVFATASGIEWAVQRGASAINVSTSYPNLTENELSALRSAVRTAWDANRPVVASAGNSNTSFVGIYPAAFKRVITVSGSNKTDTRWSSSNYGDASVPLYPNLAAPAIDMCTTDRGSSYWCSPGPNGTSFSAPMVTGTIGLMKKLYTGLSSSQIRSRLEGAADKVGYTYSGTYCGGLNVYMGCGRLDAKGAVQ
jgi:hypothetical protein